MTDFLGLLFKVKKEDSPSYHISHTFRTELGSKEALRSSCCSWIFPLKIFILSLCLSHFNVVSGLSTKAWIDLWAPEGFRINRWKKARLAALKDIIWREKREKRDIWDLDQVKLDLFRYFDHCSPCRVCSPRKITSNHNIWNTQRIKQNYLGPVSARVESDKKYLVSISHVHVCHLH